MLRDDTESPEITNELKYQWQLVRDCIAGEKRMKDKGDIYLPRKGGQSDKDYLAYKARAKWADYTEQALNAMHGMIFRKAPTIEIPQDEQLVECVKNFNKEGDSLYQFASNSAYDNMQTSFGGFLVDMPKVETVLTVYDAEKAGIRPFCKYYAGEKIRDWKWKYINNLKQLGMIILEEDIESERPENEFAHEILKQCRIFDLFEDKCRVRVFREWTNLDTKEKEDELISESFITINGKPLEYIPFFFAPSKYPEKPMLYGVAELNKHYYMQSADYENGVHYTTIPTGYATGHVQEIDEKTKKPIPIRLGGDAFLNFQEDTARVGTLQFAGEGLEHCEKALASTQEQIGILGTRSISPDKAMSETSDAAKIHRQGENAKLATYARNLSETFTKILRTMADWLNVKGGVCVSFNVDYDTITFDPNMMNSIANLAREGKYPLPLVFEALDRGELLPNNFTLREFATLVDMENAGATPMEIIETYQKMRSGELLGKVNQDYATPKNKTINIGDVFNKNSAEDSK